MRAAVPAYHNVFQHGHLLEQADVLKRTTDPQGSPLMGLAAIERLSLEDNGPFVLLIDPGNTIKQGRLPRPIWTNDGMNTARLDVYIHAVNCYQAAKPFRDLLCLKDCHVPPRSLAAVPPANACVRANTRTHEHQVQRSGNAAALPSPTGTNLPCCTWIKVPFLMASPACLPSGPLSMMVIFPSALVRPGKSLILASSSRTFLRSLSRLLAVLSI